MIKCDSVLEFISKAKSIMSFSSNPEKLVNFINKSENEIFQECEELKDKSILQTVYELRCPDCCSFIKKFYYFIDIKDEEHINCTFCDNEIRMRFPDDYYVNYEVNRELL